MDNDEPCNGLLIAFAPCPECGFLTAYLLGSEPAQSCADHTSTEVYDD